MSFPSTVNKEEHIYEWFPNQPCVSILGRPDSFPPSYEQSQRDRQPAAPELVTVDGVDVAGSPAPPLYSQDSWEALGCTWSWEQPPPYREAGCIQQQHAL